MIRKAVCHCLLDYPHYQRDWDRSSYRKLVFTMAWQERLQKAWLSMHLPRFTSSRSHLSLPTHQTYEEKSDCEGVDGSSTKAAKPSAIFTAVLASLLFVSLLQSSGKLWRQSKLEAVSDALRCDPFLQADGVLHVDPHVMEGNFWSAFNSYPLMSINAHLAVQNRIIPDARSPFLPSTCITRRRIRTL